MKIKFVLILSGIACAALFVACNKGDEPTTPAHYNVELSFNAKDVEQIAIDTIKKYDAMPLVDTIFIVPNDDRGIGGDLWGYNKDGCHNIRLFLEERVDTSPKVRGKGDLQFDVGAVMPTDSLWFVQQGWTVNQRRAQGGR